MTTMMVAVQTVDEGPLDFNRKSGDIVLVYLDSDPTPGNQEKKSWLITAFDYPTNQSGGEFPPAYMAQLKSDMMEEEYGPGPTPDANKIRRARKYSIPNWAQQFSADELVTIRDANAFLADGDTTQGGTVLSGVVSGLFSFADIVRK